MVGEEQAPRASSAVAWSLGADGQYLSPTTFTTIAPYNLNSARGLNITIGQSSTSPGQIVGCFSPSNTTFTAFAWSSTSGLLLLNNPPGANYSSALGVDFDGTVIGESGVMSGPGGPVQSRLAFVWKFGTSAGAVSALPGTNNSTAVAIRNGRAVGSDGANAVSWDVSAGSAPVMLSLLPSSTAALATALNASGQIVGESYFVNAASKATLFLGTNTYDLNNFIPSNSGWVLIGARGINDAGQIVGYGTHNGQQRAFLLTPTPSQ